MSPRLGFIIGAIVIALLAAVPFVASGYHLALGISLLYFTVLATAWALFSIQRIIGWEVPSMPPRVVWLRAAVSLPLPFLAAATAMLIHRP